MIKWIVAVIVLILAFLAGMIAERMLINEDLQRGN